MLPRAHLQQLSIWVIQHAELQQVTRSKTLPWFAKISYTDVLCYIQDIAATFFYLNLQN